MKALLQTIGGLWAAFGVYYLVILFGNEPGDLAAGMGIVFAMVLWILPGLVVAGIGSAIGRRQQ